MKNSIFRVFAIALFSSFATQLWAQTDSVRALRLLVDADAFFIDNEYKSPTVKGYTLPGVRLRPALAFDPLETIHLELGAELLYFHGANHYPNYAYHDIATWKGHQYSHAVHATPWFRADATIGPATFTLGALHRNETISTDSSVVFHDLSLPLYNPECAHSSDPEMGIEGRIALPRYNLDAWVNWESMIYRLDTHQEAFMAGVTQRIGLFRRLSAEGISLSMPLQLVFQHRGGEIDATNMGAQSLCNIGGGLSLDWRKPHGVVRHIGVEILPMESVQLSGALWPRKFGFGLWSCAHINLWQRVNARLGYLLGHDFRSLYGAPFFHNTGRSHTGYYHASYTHPFATRSIKGQQHRFALGLGLKGYIVNAESQTHHSLSVDLTFQASLDFLLKRFAVN